MKKLHAVLAAVLAIGMAIPASAAESAPAVGEASKNVQVKAGRMLYTASGEIVRAVYSVTPAGDPQVIIDGRLVTVPAATLSMSGRKLVTTLSLAEIKHLARPL